MSSRLRLLLVEDDHDVAEPLKTGLERNGFGVVHAATGTAALQLLDGIDMVLLDLNLPDLDGYEVCRRIRERSDVPVIAVTARSDEIDKVMGLKVGADDYVVKPYGFHELMARIEAVDRRTGRAWAIGRPDQIASSATKVASGAAGDPDARGRGPLQVNVKSRRVVVRGSTIELTPKEFDLLALLAEDPGTVFKREDIISRVWDENWFGSTRTLDVHIAQLRSKLGHPEWVETIRGVGFRLALPAPES